MLMECGQDRSKVKCSPGSNTVLWVGFTKRFSLGFTWRWKRIKMQTSQYSKSRIWEMKEDTKRLAENQVCAIIHMGEDSEKRFTPIYKALYGDAMSGSLWGSQLWPPESNRNICFWVFLVTHEFVSWETHKDESNIYSKTRNVKVAKSKKVSNVFNQHTSFPGRLLMPRHPKAWKFKRLLSQNEEPFGTENCCE